MELYPRMKKVFISTVHSFSESNKIKTTFHHFLKDLFCIRLKIMQSFETYLDAAAQTGL